MNISKKHYSDNGAPEGKTFNNLQLNDTYTDLISGDTYRCTKPSAPTTWSKEPNLFGTKGQAPTITVGTTTTIPAGQPAKVTDVDAGHNVVLNFEIPQGPQGETGSGGGTSVVPYDIYVVASGTDDTTNLNNAIQQSKLSGRPIRLAGNYKVSSSWILPKDHYGIDIAGNASITPLNNSAYAVIDSEKPATTAQAEQMVERRMNIRGITISAGTNQIAFAPGPNKGSKFSQIKFNGGAYGVLMRFGLNVKFELCEVINQQYGMVVAHGGPLPFGTMGSFGTWGDATISNSCSNVTSVEHCRGYSNSSANDAAFVAYASDDVTFAHCITEGVKYKRPYYIDSGGSTTVKRSAVINPHYECITHSTDVTNEALCYVRMNGKFTLSEPLAHYNIIYINALGQGGPLDVQFLDLPYLVLVNGKAFYNGGNTAWAIKRPANFGTNPSIIPGLFAGTQVTPFDGNAGYNKFTFEPIPYG